MIKLTEEDVFTFGGEYYNGNNDFVIVDGHVNDEVNIKLRQQILDDYEKSFKLKDQFNIENINDLETWILQLQTPLEKARKYDERIRGLPVPEECNIYNGMTLKILLEKARKWEDFKKLYSVDDEWLIDQQDYKIAYQKLRELIEKKILEKNSELQKIIHIEHGLKSCGSDYHLQILNERDAYQKLLEASKSG